MRQWHLTTVGIALLLSLVTRPALAASEVIGSVKVVSGSASIIRGDISNPARIGTRLLEGDALETGADGRLGVILRDDAVLSLGPASRVALDRFAFAPAERRLGFTARIMRGTMAYLSGIIGRLAPESTRFETPVATVGIRGTHFAVRISD